MSIKISQWWPCAAETCCFDLTLKDIHLLYIIRVVFWLLSRLSKELTTFLRNVRPLNLVLSSPRRGFHPEDGGNIILRNVRNYLLIDTPGIISLSCDEPVVLQYPKDLQGIWNCNKELWRRWSLVSSVTHWMQYWHNPKTAHLQLILRLSSNV